MSGEVHPARSCDRVAERRRLDAERPAGAVVLGERCRDAQAADRYGLALLYLDHVLEAPPAQEATDPARANHGQLAAEAVERRQVEVVPVAVRDKCCVEAAKRRRRGSAGPAQVEHTVAEHRIGEEANAVHVHEHGRVPDVGDAEGHG